VKFWFRIGMLKGESMDNAFPFLPKPQRGTIMPGMLIKLNAVLLVLTVLFFSLAFRRSVTANSGPQYTSDGQLKFTERYREWVYLTSGFDMSYNPAMQIAGHHMFDNVFVNPEAYKAFLETGS
jgi:hypothetical protein